MGVTNRNTGLAFRSPIQLSGSRALGSNYTNNKPYPIIVTGYLNNVSAASLGVAVDGATVWVFQAASGVAPMPFFAVVPPGKNYNVFLSGGSATVASWTETQ